MSRKELKQVDPVTEGLSKILDVIIGRRKQILSMFIVLALALVGFGFYQNYADDLERSHQADISSAFSSIDLTSTDGLAELDKLIANQEGTELGAVATIIRARHAGADSESKVDKSKVRAAIKLLGDKSENIRPWSNLSLAVDGDASLDTLVAEGNPLASRILAHMMLGDRNHPGFSQTSVDPEAARAAYRNALTLIDTSTSVQLPGSTRQLFRTEVTTRLALLPGGATENLSPEAPAPAPAAE
jgi:hypothetical protein